MAKAIPTVRTTCPYCGVGCGVLATPDGAGGLAIAGDPLHPANFGRLCVKGSALGETVDLAGRLLHPLIDGERVSWPTALDQVAAGFSQAIAQHGPESVAFYVSGQLLTEDYYVANKLMKGFIGAGNIDTNSRLCMSSAVAAHTRAFGSDTVPGCYEDLEEADLIVLVGSNAAWCHPVLFQRIMAAKAQRPSMRLVVVDPRHTASVEGADLHLALKPGSDVALFNGLLVYLADHGYADHPYIAAHTNGVEAAVAAARDGDVAGLCDLDEDDIATFYRWFAETERVVTVTSQGVNQSSAGTDKANAVINCHLLTGRIGKPGMGPLSFTGQPNAMGGREVGGLATMLAAHLGFGDSDRDRLGRFWGSKNIAPQPGLKAVDLFQAMADGTIKAVWIMATNPVVSMPDAGLVRRALETCPLVVVSDVMRHTDTTAYGDILLPALAWAEKDGTVTNTERRISRQRAVLPAPGEAKADWWMLAEVAARMGYGAAFNFTTAGDVFREHARLSGFENNGQRDFDISGLVEVDYAAFPPVQWPVLAGGEGVARLLGDGRFFHPDHRARFIPTPARPTARVCTPAWPLALNTGRTRDHWHTMTRTGKSPRLASHAAEPWLAIHPADAARFGLVEDDFARISSPHGSAVMRVVYDPCQRVGDVYAPMHWNQQFASEAGIGGLIAPFVDPVSGQPELKHTPVMVVPVAMTWQARLYSRSEVNISALGPAVQWSRSQGIGHSRWLLAGEGEALPWGDWLATQWADQGVGADRLEYRDRRLGLYRTALIAEGQLEVALFVGRQSPPPVQDWIAALFSDVAPLDRQTRADLLAGQRVSVGPDVGPIVCACHQVGKNTLMQAITAQGLTTVEAIGEHLKAGTNCGSCIPELRGLLRG